jgi:hypothetical protein
MGLKKQLLDLVKKNYPTFDAETDGFTIEFEGGGDSFGSFYDFNVFGSEDWRKEFEGPINFPIDENFDLFYQIIEQSGVDYNWNDAGTTGKIYYQEHDTDGMLNVECTLSYESYGEIEDDEE